MSEPASAAVEAPAAPEGKKLIKRKVALHVGYVGSAYKGLQKLRDDSSTIEEELERAIFKIGGISERNYGELGKVKWSRSSRTDKGVHSLATVCCLKMLVEPDHHDRDPEGLELAARMNEHLPAEIRIFAAQRVTKGWRARQAGKSRLYTYYLPAFVLGIEGKDAVEDGGRLARFRACLKAFEGNRPFHNYTKRSIYQPDDKPGKKDRRPKPWKRGRGGEDDEEEEEEDKGPGELDETDEEETAAVIQQELREAELAAAAAAAEAADKPRGGVYCVQYQKTLPDGQVVTQSMWKVCYWKGDALGKDVVNRSHFRNMLEVTASDVVEIGGVKAVQVTLHGASFMLHQIRHMVGTAAAVARGFLPLPLVEASLETPCRLGLPRAPPHCLVLAESFFHNFSAGYAGKQDSAATIYSGPTLTLREGGQKSQREFEQQVLNPALATLLSHPDYAEFNENLSLYQFEADRVEGILQSAREWTVLMAAYRARKEAERQARFEAREAENAHRRADAEKAEAAAAAAVAVAGGSQLGSTPGAGGDGRDAVALWGQESQDQSETAVHVNGQS